MPDFYPTNEMGVVALLIDFLDRHGFELVDIQSQYPDASIKDRETGRMYLAELEYRSSNFLLHRHNPKHCDVLICWQHDSEEKGIPLPICCIADNIFCVDSKFSSDEKDLWFLRLENERLTKLLSKPVLDSGSPPNDWRNLRPTLTDEDVYNLAYLSPAQVKEWAYRHGVTERTVENWRSNARVEVGVD